MIATTAPILYLCPDCGSPAILHKTWDKDSSEAGYLECTNDTCDYYEEHEHENLSIETGQYDYYDPGDYYGHGYTEFRYYVCDDCGVDIPRDVRDPDEDAAEAKADWEADNWDPDR